MSLSDILGSALSGMNAAQAGLRSASNNIANVATPGYAREQVNLETGVTSGRVSGVRVGEPQRVADRHLEATVYRRSGDWGRSEAAADYLDRLQVLLGAPGSPSGLPARLDAVGAAATAMTAGTAGDPTIRAFTTAVQDALTGMKQLGADMVQLRGDAAGEVGYVVDRINDLLRRIDTLNDTVARQAAMGRATGGATDLRMTAVQELSGLINLSVREQSDGRLTVESAGGVTLVDRRLRQLSYPAGDSAAQPTYPPIEVRFADGDGGLGAATGEQLEGASVGGRLGGLIQVRDRLLPAYEEQLGRLFGAMAESLNAVSNAGTTVPAPRTLSGSNTGLVASDRLHFTGRVVASVLQADGRVAAATTVDFDALGPGATIADAVTAINSGLGGAATASFADGRLVLTANGATQGVALAQDPAAPSNRAGAGFAHFFGLNDLVTATGPTRPSGLTAADPHGFAAGQSAQFALRDASGRLIAQQSLMPAASGTVGDLVTALNGGDLAGYGSFALDARGRLEFTSTSSASGTSLSVIADSTDRHGTGRSWSSLMGLSGLTDLLAGATVRSDLFASPQKLPLARLNTAAAVGERAVGAGDTRGANAFVDQLRTPLDLGRGQMTSMETFATTMLGRLGMDAADAADRLTDSDARRTEAINRRDSYSGVNVDEELSQLVVLQNSYSAAARVMTTATQMYDTLLAMVK